MGTSLLTSDQVARLLGVAPATVKRWADAGLLPCARTAGAHRRFEPAEVSRLARAQAAPADAPAGRGAAATPADPAEAWLDRLAAEPDPVAVHASLLGERARLGSWWRVADALGPVVAAIGRRWEEGRLGVVEEHALSERFLRALSRVAEGLPARAGAPRVLLASAEGDEHTLGLALAELAFREWGWATLWAGRSTPAAALAEAVARGDAEVLAVSASVASPPGALAAEVAALAPACRAAGVALVLGGAGAWPEPSAPGRRVRTFAELRAFLAAEDARRAGPRAAEERIQP
jgi:excisionase family DNA binding protein